MVVIDALEDAEEGHYRHTDVHVHRYLARGELRVLILSIPGKSIPKENLPSPRQANMQIVPAITINQP